MVRYEDRMSGLQVKRVLNVDNDVSVGRDLAVVRNMGLPVTQLVASGAAPQTTGLLLLSHATVPVVATIPAPTYAGQLFIIRNNSASGTAAHTVTAPTGVTLDGTNNRATLDAPGEQLILMSISKTAFIVLLNTGSVGLATV
jgi:hypothetical protein